MISGTLFLTTMNERLRSEIAQLKEINQGHLESLRRKETLHRAELEKRQRLEWRAHQKQLQELNEAKRTVASNKKELAQLSERLHFKEAECDKLESEVKRLRSAESWRSVSPTSSIDDLTSHNVYSIRERDMSMRNSELSFRIRTLEDTLSTTNKEKKSLEAKLTDTQSEINPLKEQNSKLKVQWNELNATLRSREKKANHLSQELLEVKSLYQSLQEEHEKQQKNLKKHVTQYKAQEQKYKTQEQKLLLRNNKLKDAYDKLSERVKELEENNNQLQEQSFIMPSLPTSPLPSTTCTHPDDDEPLSVSSSSSQLQEHIDQLKFDKDEMEAKYEEIKNEYKDVREKYKALHHHFQQVKVKHEDSLLQIRRKFGGDQLALEKEVILLRSVQTENLSDQKRSNYILISLEEEKRKLLQRIETLENFIIEQDDLMARREVRWKEEFTKLNTLLDVSVTCQSCQEGSFEATLYDHQALDRENRDLNVIYDFSGSNTNKTEQMLPHLKHIQSPEEQCLLKYVEKETQTCLEDSSTTEDIDEDSTTEDIDGTGGELSTSAQQSLKDESKGPRKIQDHVSAVKYTRSQDSPEEQKEMQIYLQDSTTEDIDGTRGEFSASAHQTLKDERKIQDHASAVKYTRSQDSPEKQCSLKYVEREMQTCLQAEDIDGTGGEFSASAQQSLKDESKGPRKIQDHVSADKYTRSQDSPEKQCLLKYVEKEMQTCLQDSTTEDRDGTGGEFSAVSKEAASAQQSLKDELKYKEKKIQDLQNHVSKMHLELELKLAKAEQELELQTEIKDQLISSLELKLQDLNNALQNLRSKYNGLEYDRLTATKLAQDVNESLSKVESYHSNIERIGHVSKNLSVLRESISELLQIMNLKLSTKQTTSESIKPPESVTILTSAKSERKLPYHRIFVVVMDYDPQSLCITGKPELELPVQSGSVVCVLGEMDENGYYKVSCNSKGGLVPANFVQEIELCDEELIKRIMNQDFTWGTKRPDTENIHEFSFLKKERAKSEAILEMSLTESSSTSPGNAKVDLTAGKQACKIFLGLYDYNPKTSSSSENPEFELSFKEGSLLKIFGQKMSDGYYVGELNGKRGLVPADFIIDTTSTHMKESSASLFLKSKKMTALYDYQPPRDSPNTYFDTELAFKTGDHITVYVDQTQHDDGFYSGQLGDNFGLVPSNFLKEHSP